MPSRPTPKSKTIGEPINSAIGNGTLEESDLFFDPSRLGSPSHRYVGWIDLMGSAHLMTTSMPIIANHLGRFHLALRRSAVACNFSSDDSNFIMPINDGAFLISKKRASIEAMLRGVIVRLAQYFINTERGDHRFFVRGALAYGPIYTKGELQRGFVTETKPELVLASNLFFGPPISQAYDAEKLAAPFGIALDPSARAFGAPGTDPFFGAHWFWWSGGVPFSGKHPQEIAAQLLPALQEQIEFLRRHAIMQELTADQIDAMERRINEYFIAATEPRASRKPKRSTPTSEQNDNAER